MRVVNVRLTKRPFQPVTGCVRTTGLYMNWLSVHGTCWGRGSLDSTEVLAGVVIVPTLVLDTDTEPPCFVVEEVPVVLGSEALEE
jgi:hypothetical protein